MPPRIEHIFQDNIEKKRCSKCKQYLSLDNFIYKADRWDKLHNECIKCSSIRNKRRTNPDFNFPENLITVEEYKDYLEKNNSKRKK